MYTSLIISLLPRLLHQGRIDSSSISPWLHTVCDIHEMEGRLEMGLHLVLHQHKAKIDSCSFLTPSSPDVLDASFEHAQKADLCLAMGSSLTVTPAADIPEVCFLLSLFLLPL